MFLIFSKPFTLFSTEIVPSHLDRWQKGTNKFSPCLTPISHLKNDENLSLFLIEDLTLSDLDCE
jgi:hypothetical protein